MGVMTNLNLMVRWSPHWEDDTWAKTSECISYQGEDHGDKEQQAQRPWGPSVCGMDETEWGMGVGKPLDGFEQKWDMICTF